MLLAVTEMLMLGSIRQESLWSLLSVMSLWHRLSVLEAL